MKQLALVTISIENKVHLGQNFNFDLLYWSLDAVACQILAEFFDQPLSLAENSFQIYPHFV